MSLKRAFSKPTISVVIPLFNKAPHIADAITSVLAQTDLAEEVIVVDDGSTDEGYKIVENFAARGVSLIRQKNQGVSAARNAGVKQARSEFVAFLDADDLWLPNHLQVIRDLLSAYPSVALASTAHNIRRDDRLYRPASVFPHGWSGIVSNFFEAQAKGLALANSTTSCVNKDSFNEIGGFPVGIRRGEDIVTWINLALRFPVAHAEVATAIYNQAAVNRTDQLRESVPPGSLKHIAALLIRNDLTVTQRNGLSMLFDKLAFYTAAGFSLTGDRLGINEIRMLAINVRHFGTASAIWILGFIPNKILLMARRLRHKQART